MSVEKITQILEAHGPMTTFGVAQHMPFSHTTVSVYLARMKRKNLLHITDWEARPPGKRGREAPIYKLGEAPAMPAPHKPLVKPRPKPVRTTPEMRQEAGMWSGLLR